MQQKGVQPASPHQAQKKTSSIWLWNQPSSQDGGLGFVFFCYSIPSKGQWKGISKSCKSFVSFSLDHCLCWYLPAELLGGDFQNIRSVLRNEQMNCSREDMPPWGTHIHFPGAAELPLAQQPLPSSVPPCPSGWDREEEGDEEKHSKIAGSSPSSLLRGMAHDLHTTSGQASHGWQNTLDGTAPTCQGRGCPRETLFRRCRIQRYNSCWGTQKVFLCLAKGCDFVAWGNCLPLPMPKAHPVYPGDAISSFPNTATIWIPFSDCCFYLVA